MGNKVKMYYKKAEIKDGKAYFSQTINTIKTEHLSLMAEKAIKEYAEADKESFTRRSAVVFLEDDDYDKCRVEARMSAVPKGDPNDYIAFFTEDDKMICMIRAVSTKRKTLKEFTDYELEQAKLKKDKNETVINSHMLNNKED